MLPSYEAMYDRGRLTWIGDAPTQAQARVIVTLINEPTANHPTEPNNQQEVNNWPEATQAVPNGTRLVAVLTEMAEKGIGTVFGDPMEWQREVRRDRPYHRDET